MKSSQSPALILLAVLSVPALVRADQAVITDVMYTHSADTTSDSHYRVKPLPSSPADWTSPVDYTKGSAHVLLEVKTKPAGDTPTKFQICFEGTPEYACTAQAPTYTKPGKYEWDTKFTDFWYGGDVDWSKGVTQVALILKDTNNGKPQGDPKYVPSDLHVQVTLVSAGATFAPPPAAGSGAEAGSGSAGQGGRGAGSGGRAAAGSGGRGSLGGRGGSAAVSGRGAAGSAGSGAAGSEPEPADAGAPTAPPRAGMSAAGAGRTGASAGTGAAAGSVSGAAGTPTETTTSPATGAGSSAEAPPKKDDSGCSTTGAGGSGSAAFVVLALLWLGRRKRD